MSEYEAGKGGEVKQTKVKRAPKKMDKKKKGVTLTNGDGTQYFILEHSLIEFPLDDDESDVNEDEDVSAVFFEKKQPGMTDLSFFFS